MIPTDVQDGIKENLNNTVNNTESKNVVKETKERTNEEGRADAAADEQTKQIEALRAEMEKMAALLTVHIPVGTSAQPIPKKKVEERVADRGPMMNVHVPLDIKKKIMDVKNARNLMGEKISVDTIIYECILAWLDKNYDKIMAKASI